MLFFKNSLSPLVVFGNVSASFRESITPLLPFKSVQPFVSRFADGEVRVELRYEVKNKRVFLIHNIYPLVNEQYMELFVLIDALKQNGAQEIHVLIPYLGYSRQDRMLEKGNPISARLMVHLLKKAGASKIVTVDIHSQHTLDYFKKEIIHLEATHFLADKLKEQIRTSQLICVSPDFGGIARTEKVAQTLQTKNTFMKKQRAEVNQATAVCVEDSVEGQDVLIVDDIIDTAGTLVASSQKLIESGAKNISVLATHGLFSGPALERIEKSPIQRIWVSDSVSPRKDSLESKKIQIISLVDLMASYLDSYKG